MDIGAESSFFAKSSRLWLGFHPTPLLDASALAARCEVARVRVKAESYRPLGNFKSLGGISAGLRALGRACGAADVAGLKRSSVDLPTLLCASDGNHGLAIAAAAQIAGARARVYLPKGVGAERAARIRALRAEVVQTADTYDDAVSQAAAAAACGEGILVADATGDPDDCAVADVMDGYAVMAEEILEQIEASRASYPSHLFIQAGVGGLAAALAKHLRHKMSVPKIVAVVEPASAACVASGLAAGRPRPLAHAPQTSAEMLACGLASAPALAILLQHEAKSVLVDEDLLRYAVDLTANSLGLRSTPSGTAGVAGLLAAAEDRALRRELRLGPSSDILLVATEGVLTDACCLPLFESVRR